MARRARTRRSEPTGQQTRQGFVSTRFAEPDVPDYVVAELRYESPVAFTTSRFVAPAAAAPQADSLNTVLARFDIAAVRSHFAMPSQAIRARVEVAATLPPEPDPSRYAKRGMDTEFKQSGFVQIVPKAGQDAKRIANELNREEGCLEGLRGAPSRARDAHRLRRRLS